MRKVVPETGATRIVCGFLYFPMTLKRDDGRYERRWLELAGVKYQWLQTKRGHGWCPIQWANA